MDVEVYIGIIPANLPTTTQVAMVDFWILQYLLVVYRKGFIKNIEVISVQMMIFVFVFSSGHRI